MKAGGKIKIGQLGICHEHAAAKMAALRGLSDVFEIVGVVDDRFTTSARFAGDNLEPYEGVTWLSEDELFSTPGLQAVVVETPNMDLVPAALRCIKKGLHLHMDKPAGNDIALFNDLLNGCRDNHLFLQMGYMLRNNPAIQFCQRAVHEGWLGEIFQIQADMNHDYGGEAYQQYLFKMEGGILFNLGCHLIDLVVSLLGRPVDVTPFLKSTANVDPAIANNGLAVLEYPHATVTLRSCSQAVDGINQRRLTVCGTKGTFNLHPLEIYDGSPIRATLLLAEATNGYTAGYHSVEFPGTTDRYRAQLLELAQLLKGEVKNPYSYEHDRLVQEVVLAAAGDIYLEASIMKKKWTIAIARDTAVRSLGWHGLHVAFSGLPGVEVGGFYDTRADDLETIMAVTKAKRHYRNYTEMLETEKPDIVVLCSRHPNDHFAQIREAATRGIHIYCEKPMTVSLKEADAIVELVEKTGIKFCMAHPCRYDAGFLQMKRMIEAGEIGKPLTIYGRGKSDHRGGGEDMMVLGTHILDLQTFFFGAPASVWAEVFSKGEAINEGELCETVEPIGPAAGDDIFASFRFPNGVRGLFESRRGLVKDPHQDRTRMGIAVIGTRGTLSLRFDDRADATLKQSSLKMPPDDDANFEEVKVDDTRVISGSEPLDLSLRGVQTPTASLFLKSNRYAVWDLMQSIVENRQPVSNMLNARLALEMIYGIYASQLSESLIRFPLPHREHPLGKYIL